MYVWQAGARRGGFGGGRHACVLQEVLGEEILCLVFPLPVRHALSPEELAFLTSLETRRCAYCGKKSQQSEAANWLQTIKSERPELKAEADVYQKAATTKPGKMARCARCKVVFYCGREHQTLHWKAHKQSCKPAA